MPIPMRLPLALTLLLASVPAAAQTEPPAFHVIAFTTGATTMSVDPINAVLTQANFAGLSNDGISYGATAHYAFGRALLGANYSQTVFGEEGLSNGRTDALTSRQFAGTASLVVFNTSHLIFYPTLGVGMGTFDVILRDRSGGAAASASQPTFAEVAQSPGTESIVSGRHLLYSAGAGIDYLVTRAPGDAFGIVFGVRGGLFLAPNRTTWMLGSRTVVAGPDASAGGPFVRVVVGIGHR